MEMECGVAGGDFNAIYEYICRGGDNGTNEVSFVVKVEIAMEMAEVGVDVTVVATEECMERYL